MQRSALLERERKIVAEKNIKHLGTARIDVCNLEFPSDRDEENVEALTALFKEDFQGLNPKYHIPAKINPQDLDNALHISGLSALCDGPVPDEGYPQLQFPPGFRLQCLRGRSRAEAVQRAFPPGARRWTVDLFRSGRWSRLIADRLVTDNI